MKKLSFLLCLFLVKIMVTGQQVWLPDGAEWHYGFDRADPALSFGYIEIKQVGDTVVLGKSCKIIDQVQYRYRTWYPTPGYDSGSVGKVITYSDDTKVYTYLNNRFYTLYDFGATVGTTWTVCWFGGIQPDTGQVIVTGVDSAEINGQMLKLLHVTRTPGSCIGWTSAVIAERMGCINEYMFPDYDFTCIVDVQINGYFRCYQDNGFPLYSIDGSDTICDYITATENQPAYDPGTVRVFPNPASSTVMVESTLPGLNFNEIDLFTLQGKKLLEFHFSSRREKEVNLDNVNPGMYLLQVITERGILTRKKVIIE
jgi:hypothetical protein